MKEDLDLEFPLQDSFSIFFFDKAINAIDYPP